MRAAAQQQAQEAAHRLTYAAIAGAGARVVTTTQTSSGNTGRQRSETPSTSAGALGTRSPSVGSTARSTTSSVEPPTGTQQAGAAPGPRSLRRIRSGEVSDASLLSLPLPRPSERSSSLLASEVVAAAVGNSAAGREARQTGQDVAREMLEMLMRPTSNAGSNSNSRLPWPSSTQLQAEAELEHASPGAGDGGANLSPVLGRPGTPAASRSRSNAQSAADSLDQLVLQEELRKKSELLARATAAPELVDTLDLPGLAKLRAELVAAHALALERVDDRRVALQARQAATREGPERGRCVACWFRNADRLLLPCRHLCLCGTCMPSCGGVCPICRAAVKDSIEVFGNA